MRNIWGRNYLWARGSFAGLSHDSLSATGADHNDVQAGDIVAEGASAGRGTHQGHHNQRNGLSPFNDV